MAFLHLHRADGSSEVRELSRSNPLTIGRQDFNDICVPEEGVARLHCRIGWNKTRFEVTAATPGGVEVNSSTAAHADLKPGDIIRVGSLDLIYQEDPAAVTFAPSPRQAPAPAVPDEAPTPRKAPKKAEPKQKPVEDLSVFSGEVQTASQASFDAMFANVDPGNSDEFDSSQPKPNAPQVMGMMPRAVRPGEQEILKSPLVLGLTGGGLVLLLVTGIFWFLIAREQTNKLYDRAVREMNDGQFAQAVASFEQFVQQYPNHALRRLADRGLAKTLVMKEISGASPAWKRGLERVNELIKAHRNESDFNDLHSSLFQFGEQISLGAAKSAESARDPELLVISKDAQDLLERFSDPANPPTGTLARINEQRIKAERAIEKQKTFDQAMKTVDTAIADRKPMSALSHRERLVRAFPEFISSKRVKEALQKALELEKSVVKTDETERPAETTDDSQPGSDSILGVLHARSRADEASQGRIGFVIAKDCCYAIDATTGELIWRRVIGVDVPFFPVSTSGAQPSALLFDTRRLALISCRLSDGKLIWRQPLNARAIGKPLVHEGQIYLAIDGQALVRLDLDTGRMTARVQLSQNLSATPALSRDGDYLFVPGQLAMIYTLALRTMSARPPLAVVALTFTDHAAGSVVAPPLSMGRLLLLCENNKADSARLRLWDAGNPTISLPELASSDVRSQVRDVPVLRGNQLVVPSAGERFSAFVVTDEAGRAGITLIGEYRATGAESRERIDAPLFVAIGSDGQFWSAGTAFRRFEINSNNIRMDSNVTATGIASQPLQLVGEQFLVGRKSRASDAVTFSSIDRERLINPWRTILGDRPLEMLATRDGGFVWVGQSGSLYNVGKTRLAQGGFEQKAGVDLELPANLSKPIRASVLHDQRMVVAAPGETVQLFVLNSTGQVVGNHKLDEAPEADPILLDEGLILPVPARLKVLSLSGSKKVVQEWIAPVGESLEHRWEFLLRIDGREFIACENGGRLMRIQFRQGEVAHLAEVAKLQLEHPVDVRPFVRGDNLYLADAGGNCRQMNVHSFDTDGQRTLPGPIKNIWPAGPHLLAHAGDGKLYCLADGKGLPEQWTFDLAKLEPTGPVILKDEALWLACRSGTVLVLNPNSGKEIRRVELPQLLSLGLRQLNESLFAVATDGTLYRVDGSAP